MQPFPAGRAGAVLLVLAAAGSTQFGAAVAALLFPRVGPLGVVTLRLALSAAILLVLFRPRLSGRSAADWRLVAAFGLALGGMNTAFYAAIDRIPLGAAVTLELLGPLALSVVAARRWTSLVWAGLALTGVVLLGGGDVRGLDPLGVLFALVAAALWAAYIVLSSRVGRRFARADGLALAMAVAAALSLPFGLAHAGGALLAPGTLAAGATVAVLSSALPYSLEMAALRRLPAATFAVMMSLAPAIAALAGFLVLDQALGPVQLAAIALVALASAGAVRAAGPRGADAAPP
ncbi:EamA family transporter [Georgenia faecalis]|uniref:DMT family transporter n=1 Tax=Georgenia faecalis TaxID=2483799 RepID=A0ABV9D7G4_9MICO|nr:EamA family transporter [Georgenia faecalis]